MRLPELIDAQFRAQLTGWFDLVVLNGDAGGIGNFYHRVENGHGRCAIHQRRAAKRPHDTLSGCPQPGSIAVDRRIREITEQACVRHGLGISVRCDDSIKIMFHRIMFTTRTEQYQMAGGSVKTTIERGYPGRNKLYLCMTDGAGLESKVAQLSVRQPSRSVPGGSTGPAPPSRQPESSAQGAT